MREKIKKDNIGDIEEEYNYKLDLSPYGNYLFIIATNKTFKSFKEVEYSIKTFAFEDDGPDESFKKCFETTHKNKIKNKNKVIKGKKESNPNFDILNISCDIKQKEKIAKKKYINDFDYSADVNKKMGAAGKFSVIRINPSAPDGQTRQPGRPPPRRDRPWRCAFSGWGCRFPCRRRCPPSGSSPGRSCCRRSR